MKTLQIHIGEINKKHEQCIASVNDMYNLNIFIGDHNYKGLLEDMCNSFGFNIRNFTSATTRGRVVISDFLRMFILSCVKDVLYIDTDVICLEKFNPLRFDKPYFSKCDIWAIYNGVYIDFFREKLQKIKRVDILGRICPPPHYYNVIEEKYFKHLNLRSWKNG